MQAFEKEMVKVRKEAYEEGRKAGIKQALDWLENRYIGKDRPPRGSKAGIAILELAAELGKFLRS